MDASAPCPGDASAPCPGGSSPSSVSHPVRTFPLPTPLYTSPSPVTTPAPATTSSSSTPSASGPSLSRRPLSQEGRSKAQRWCGDSSAGGSSSSPRSFKEAVLSSSDCAATPSPSAGLCAVCPSPATLPVVEDGWQVVGRRQRSRGVHLPRQGSRVDLRGRCYNCLSTSHLVASCRRPTRCLRCFCFGHRAAKCSTPPVETKKPTVWQRLGCVKTRLQVRQETSQKALVWSRAPVRPPVWQRLSNMDLVPSPEDNFQEPSRRKASVWKRLVSSQDHATSEAIVVADNKMCTRPMRKKRRSKHGKDTAAQNLGPTQTCPPPPPPPQLDCFRSEVAWPPSASSCVLDFSEDLAREEIALRRAMFVSVTGSRPGVSGSDVLKEVRHCFGVKLEDMRIHQTYPEDFLLFLPDEDTATKVLNEGRPLRGPRFSLLLKRWSRFAHASSSSMAELVVVRLTGIPQHAWCRSTAEQLLRDSCWVEALHSDALEMRDFSALIVKAWCFDPEKLVRKMDLHILEAGSMIRKRDS
jgi:hypothetical protein